MVKHETDRLLAPTNQQSALVARIATNTLTVALPGLPVNTSAETRKAYMNILTEQINELSWSTCRKPPLSWSWRRQRQDQGRLHEVVFKTAKCGC